MNIGEFSKYMFYRDYNCQHDKNHIMGKIY